jgi:hypothetical protein
MAGLQNAVILADDIFERILAHAEEFGIDVDNPPIDIRYRNTAELVERRRIGFGSPKRIGIR